MMSSNNNKANSRLARVLGQLGADVACKTIENASCASTLSKKPIKVVVTGAAGNIGYAIIFMIAQGAMLGPDQPIELRLLDIPPMAKVIEGVLMEVNDGAFPLISSVIGTTDYKTAFDGVEVALLVGAKPRGPGMVRADLLKANANIFSGQGKALNKYASRNVKVCVVGNPANTNALLASENAPDLPSSCFSALTRLDQNRAVSMLAGKIGCPAANIRNLIVWGNHSKTQYPDVTNAVVLDYPSKGRSTPVVEAVNDEAWLQGTFVTTVASRGSAIIQARKKSSAASAANAAVDHVRTWMLGTAPGEVASMAVLSDGSYGVPKGIVYSFPVTCSGGEYSIIRDLPISKFSRGKIDASAAELISERTAAHTI